MPAFWLSLKPQYQAAFGIAILATLWMLTGLIRFGAATSKAEAKATEDSHRARRHVDLKASRRHDHRARPHPGFARSRCARRSRRRGSGFAFRKRRPRQAGQLFAKSRSTTARASAAQAQALVAQAGKGTGSRARALQRRLPLQDADGAIHALRTRPPRPARRRWISSSPTPRCVRRSTASSTTAMSMSATTCGSATNARMLIAPEPFLAVGTVGEDEVGQIAIGNTASATLVTGRDRRGKVRFVADRADHTTRTFRVEVELPNPDAQAARRRQRRHPHSRPARSRPTRSRPAFWCWTTTASSACAPCQNGIVRFMPVQIISDGPDGMWVTGLPDRVDVITVGQEFVTNGERVKAVFDKGGQRHDRNRRMGRQQYRA